MVVNDELCISARVYRFLEQSNRVRIFAQNSVEVGALRYGNLMPTL